MNRHEIEREIRKLSDQIALNPVNSDAYFERGELYLRLEEYGKALEDFGRVLDLSPDETLGYYNRGVCHYFLERYHEAIDDYSKALELDPYDAVTLQNRGVAFERLGLFDQALRDYRRAIQLDKSLLGPRMNMGNVLSQAMRHQEAIDVLTDVLRRAPGSGQARFFRARSLYALGRFEETLADVEAARRLGFETDRVIFLLGMVSFRLFRFNEAVAAFSSILSQEPLNKEAISYRAWSYMGLGNSEMAQADLTRLCTMIPSIELSPFLLGMELVKKNEMDSGLSNFRRVIELGGTWVQPALFYVESLLDSETRQPRPTGEQDAAAEVNGQSAAKEAQVGSHEASLDVEEGPRRTIAIVPPTKDSHPVSVPGLDSGDRPPWELYVTDTLAPIPFTDFTGYLKFIRYDDLPSPQKEAMDFCFSAFFRREATSLCRCQWM